MRVFHSISGLTPQGHGESSFYSIIRSEKHTKAFRYFASRNKDSQQRVKEYRKTDKKSYEQII